jgi:hypothetical protein
MRDSRVFHIDDPDWIKKYSDQSMNRIFVSCLLTTVLLVKFEATKNHAWVEGGPEKVMLEAPKRLREKGWNEVRPALATTIRYAESSRLHNLLRCSLPL